MKNMPTQLHSKTQVIPNASPSISRRQLLMGIMVSVGATATSSCVQRFEKTLANSPNLQQAGSPQFYTDNELALVSQLTDLIIPETDTLGALAAGVPQLLDQLYRQWGSVVSQSLHRQGLKNIQLELNELTQQNFLTAPAEQQISALRYLDEQAFSGHKQQYIAYRHLKDLIARFYYSTEVGATQELRYQLVPGRWEASILMDEQSRTWAV
jgi:hypothetical protein